MKKVKKRKMRNNLPVPDVFIDKTQNNVKSITEKKDVTPLPKLSMRSNPIDDAVKNLVAHNNTSAGDKKIVKRSSNPVKSIAEKRGALTEATPRSNAKSKNKKNFLNLKENTMKMTPSDKLSEQNNIINQAVITSGDLGASSFENALGSDAVAVIKKNNAKNKKKKKKNHGNKLYRWIEKGKNYLDDTMKWAIKDEKIPQKAAEMNPIVFVGKKASKYTKTTLDDKIFDTYEKATMNANAFVIGGAFGMVEGGLDVIQMVVDPKKTVEDIKDTVVALKDKKTRVAIKKKMENTLEGMIEGDPMAFASTGKFVGEFVGQAEAGRVGGKVFKVVVKDRIPDVKYVSEKGVLMKDNGKTVEYVGKYIVKQQGQKSSGFGFSKFTTDTDDVIAMRKYSVKNTGDKTIFSDTLETIGKKNTKMSVRGVKDGDKFMADFVLGSDDGVRMGKIGGKLKETQMSKQMKKINVDAQKLSMDAFGKPIKEIEFSGGEPTVRYKMEPKEIEIESYSGYTYSWESKKPWTLGGGEKPKVQRMIEKGGKRGNKKPGAVDDLIEKGVKSGDDTLKKPMNVTEETPRTLEKIKSQKPKPTKNSNGTMLLQKEIPKQHPEIYQVYAPPGTLDINTIDIFKPSHLELITPIASLKNIRPMQKQTQKPGKTHEHKKDITPVVIPRPGWVIKPDFEVGQEVEIGTQQQQQPRQHQDNKQQQDNKMKHDKSQKSKYKQDGGEDTIQDEGTTTDTITYSGTAPGKTPSFSVSEIVLLPGTARKAEDVYEEFGGKRRKRHKTSRKKKKKKVYESNVGDILKALSGII